MPLFPAIKLFRGNERMRGRFGVLTKIRRV